MVISQWSGALSSRGSPGHHVQLDEPQLVIKSIREVLDGARK